jgi:hypothetical protein
VPYTTCKLIPEEKCEVIKCRRCRLVTEQRTCQVPYLTCRLIPEEKVCQVPHVTCTMEPYCTTRKVYRQVPVCVPVCPPPCGCTSRRMSSTEWYARLNDRAVRLCSASAPVAGSAK